MDNKLIRRLNSVGKKAFVDHFELFNMFYLGQIDRNKAIEELIRLKVSNYSGAGIRLGNAKLIFEAKQEFDALDIILKSNRLSQSVKNSALHLKKRGQKTDKDSSYTKEQSPIQDLKKPIYCEPTDKGKEKNLLGMFFEKLRLRIQLFFRA